MGLTTAATASSTTRTPPAFAILATINLATLGQPEPWASDFAHPECRTVLSLRRARHGRDARAKHCPPLRIAQMASTVTATGWSTAMIPIARRSPGAVSRRLPHPRAPQARQVVRLASLSAPLASGAARARSARALAWMTLRATSGRAPRRAERHRSASMDWGADHADMRKSRAVPMRAA